MFLTGIVHRCSLPLIFYYLTLSLNFLITAKETFKKDFSVSAARSPCRCLRTRALHFKVKNTPLKDKKWKEKVQKNAQLSFCGGREAFHQEIVLRGIQPCLLHDGAHGLFWNATKAVTFLLNFRYILHSMAKTITFLKGNLCIFKCFIDVLRKITKCALIWNGFCVEFCHVLSRFHLRERIHDPDSVFRIALKD